MPSEAERRELADLIERGCINWADKFFDHDECVKLLAAKERTASPAAIEEAVRVVDRMTCEWCSKGFAFNETFSDRHTVGDPEYKKGFRAESCTAQGRAIVTAILPMLRGGK